MPRGETNTLLPPEGALLARGLLLLLSPSDTLVTSSLAQGFTPCSELQVKINLKERSWMDRQHWIDKNRSEKEIGVCGAQPRAGT